MKDSVVLENLLLNVPEIIIIIRVLLLCKGISLENCLFHLTCSSNRINSEFAHSPGLYTAIVNCFPAHYNRRAIFFKENSSTMFTPRFLRNHGWDSLDFGVLEQLRDPAILWTTWQDPGVAICWDSNFLRELCDLFCIIINNIIIRIIKIRHFLSRKIIIA